MSTYEVPTDGERLDTQLVYASTFLDGACYEFAIGVHRATSLPMVGLMQDVEGQEIRHAVISLSYGRYFDIRGFVDEEEVGQPFGLSPPYTLKPIDEEGMRTIRPVHEYNIVRAAQIAQMLWPDDLPWVESSLLNRVGKFLDELESLCERHGLFIHASAPSLTWWPIIAEKTEIDGNYVFRPLVNSPSFIFGRKSDPPV